jgi:hypothetical protein
MILLTQNSQNGQQLGAREKGKERSEICFLLLQVSYICPSNNMPDQAYPKTSFLTLVEWSSGHGPHGYEEGSTLGAGEDDQQQHGSQHHGSASTTAHPAPPLQGIVWACIYHLQ